MLEGDVSSFLLGFPFVTFPNSNTSLFLTVRHPAPIIRGRSFTKINLLFKIRIHKNPHFVGIANSFKVSRGI